VTGGGAQSRGRPRDGARSGSRPRAGGRADVGALTQVLLPPTERSRRPARQARPVRRGTGGVSARRLADKKCARAHAPARARRRLRFGRQLDAPCREGQSRGVGGRASIAPPAPHRSTKHSSRSAPVAQGQADGKVPRPLGCALDLTVLQFWHTAAYEETLWPNKNPDAGLPEFPRNHY